MTVSDSGGKPRRTLSLKRESAAPKIEERLHKVLAQAGLGSRRALEERIASGQIKVNGEVAQVGSSVKTGDRIELDGKVFVASALTDAPRVLIYNKPEGEVTTREDPEGRPTVFDNLPPLKGSRWIAVGRLDINTTGLLLLTTDGDLANALMHPSTEVRREYVCRIQGEVDDGVLEKLARGVELEDGMAKFDEIERIGSSDSHAWFRVVLHEGRNREVRRLWETVGFQVSRLKRTRYGSVELPRLLKRGHSEELPGASVEEMRTALKLDPPGGVLTLQSVIGQRRAKAAEYKPGPREQRAWTNGGYAADEGRELRAFDTLRDDRPARPAKSRFGAKPGGKPGGRPAGAGAPGGKPGGRRGGARAGGTDENRGNRLTAPGGQQRGQGGPRRAKDGAPPGFENPNEFRSWYVPEGVTTTSRVAPPRAQAKPGARPANPYGGKPGPRGPGAPSGRPGGGGKPGGGRPAGAGGGRPGPGPGGARSGAGPGGPRAAGPAGGRPGPRNNKPRRGGPGPNRGG